MRAVAAEGNLEKVRGFLAPPACSVQNIPSPSRMKTKIALLTAALAPLTLTAQVKEGAAGGAPAGGVAPATIQPPAAAPKRLPRVQFQDAKLSDIVEYIQESTQKLGLDPSVNPMNVVITPGMGIEKMQVPALSLRNVSPTEVLTVVTTVLGLQLDPVTGDEGQVVAWMVKKPAANGGAVAGIGGEGGAVIGAVAGGIVGHARANPASASADPANPTGSIPGEAAAPATVELAASPALAGGGGIGVAPQKQARVFGIASLIASRETDPAKAEEARSKKYARLIDTLGVMSVEQTGTQADIKFYDVMDIIVVKSDNPAVMTLIGDAIEAMKKNGAQNGEAAQVQAQAEARVQDAAMRSEIEALRGQLKLAEAEREMTRRTYADQLEVLKAAQKAQNAEPKPR
jgi:hypothetical protein